MTDAADLYGFGPQVPTKSNVNFNNLMGNGLYLAQSPGSTNGPDPGSWDEDGLVGHRQALD